jgi:hypothetical protein
MECKGEGSGYWEAAWEGEAKEEGGVGFEKARVSGAGLDATEAKSCARSTDSSEAMRERGDGAVEPVVLRGKWLAEVEGESKSWEEMEVVDGRVLKRSDAGRYGGGGRTEGGRYDSREAAADARSSRVKPPPKPGAKDDEGGREDLTWWRTWGDGRWYAGVCRMLGCSNGWEEPMAGGLER